MNGLEQLFNTDELTLGSSFSMQQIALSLTITFLISLFIHWVYKKTYSGVLYSKNFNITLVMVALIINAIVIGLSGNIVLSLGMVGALSIIRYRTAIKDPRDTAFLFWALTIGLVNGVAYYQLSILASLFVTLAVFYLTKTGNFDPSYVLILKYREGIYEEKIQPVLKSAFGSLAIRSDSSNGDIVEKVIEVRLKQAAQEEALRAIRNIKQVESCILLSSTGDFAE